MAERSSRIWTGVEPEGDKKVDGGAAGQGYGRADAAGLAAERREVGGRTVPGYRFDKESEEGVFAQLLRTEEGNDGRKGRDARRERVDALGELLKGFGEFSGVAPTDGAAEPDKGRRMYPARRGGEVLPPEVRRMDEEEVVSRGVYFPLNMERVAPDGVRRVIQRRENEVLPENGKGSGDDEERPDLSVAGLKKRRDALYIESWELWDKLNKRHSGNVWGSNGMSFTKEEKEEMEVMRRRRKSLDNALDLAKLTEEHREYDPEDPAWKQFWKGAQTGLLKDYATFGLTELGRTLDVGALMDKAARGEELNGEERTLVDVFRVLRELQESKPIDRISYHAGRFVRDAASDVLQFALTGGVSSGVKGLLKVGVKQETKRLARRLGEKALEAGVETVLSPVKLGQGYADRRLANYGFDDDGRVLKADDPSSAPGDLFRSGVSVYTDRLMSGLFGKAFRGSAEANRLRSSRFLAPVAGYVERAMPKLGERNLELVRDVVEDYVERNVSGVMSALAAGDMRYFDSFPKEQLRMVCSVLTESALKSGGRYAMEGVRKMRERMELEYDYSRLRRKLRETGDGEGGLFERFGDEDMPMDALIDGVSEVLGELGDDEGRILLKYTMVRALREGGMAAVEREMESKTGRFTVGDSDVVKCIKDREGNGYFVTGERNGKDGKVYEASDGKGNVLDVAEGDVQDMRVYSKRDFVENYGLEQGIRERNSKNGAVSEEFAAPEVRRLDEGEFPLEAEDDGVVLKGMKAGSARMSQARRLMRRRRNGTREGK